MSRAACPRCEFIHSPDDARAVGRFAGSPAYVAAHAGTPARATRAEAEADECGWRQRRTAAAVPPSTPDRRLVQPPVPTSTTRESAEFPAARMEVLAREGAWGRFLSEALFSLKVWQLDDCVRNDCETALTWLRGCHQQLGALLEARKVAA